MANNISSVSSLISDFRNLQGKDAVSTESLGYILQRILDTVADLQDPQNAKELADIRAYLEKLGNAGQVIASLNLKPGSTDVKFAPVAVDLATGNKSYSVNSVFIPHASQSTAGVMSAKDVTDIVNMKNTISQLKTRVETLEAAANGDLSLLFNAYTTPVVAFDGFYDPPADAVFTESPEYATIQWLHITSFNCYIVFDTNNNMFWRRIIDQSDGIRKEYWSSKWWAESDTTTGQAWPGSDIYANHDSVGQLKLFFDRENGTVCRYNDTWAAFEYLVGTYELEHRLHQAGLQSIEPQNSENV